MDDLKTAARRIFAAAVAAADPRRAVARHCRLDGETLVIGDKLRLRLADFQRILVIGAGKASAPMAQAVEDLLGTRISDGLVVVKRGHGAPLKKVRCLEAAHPVPDQAGVAGAGLVERMLTGLGESDLVICCLSGGASALLPAPRTGMSLADKQATTKLLLDSGADIHAINAVRKHLSRLKGGQLARLAAPATMVALVLSDVVGDDLSVIGSGPTAPDPTTFAEVRALVERHQLTGKLPPAVTALIERGVAGDEPETPKPGDPCFAKIHHCLIGSNRQALAAAAAEAKSLGFEAVVLDQPRTGETRFAATAFADRATKLFAPGRKPRCLIAGGETTVTIAGKCGKGGRAQEFALAAALAIASHPACTVLAAGTDGNDGPTDAAGAIADNSTVARAAAQKLAARFHLEAHDAYPLFQALGDLVITGPTNTNVMDVYVALSPG